MSKILRISFIVLIFISACSTPRQLTELIVNADQAFKSEDYNESLRLYEEFMASQNNDPLLIPDSVFRGAGLSAFNLEKSDKALGYLNQIRHSEVADYNVHYALARLNREIDNLSREITALESYFETKPADKPDRELKKRLFETYVESRNYEKALEVWEEIETYASKNEKLLNRYFSINQALENEENLDDIARDLLALNPNNTDALFHLAKHYFWRAENRYQSEMEAYERNRTHRQYAQLLRAFEILNDDFHRSLNYFLRLYEIDPKPSYARYIGNIYLRFDDKSKARYYHGKAEG